jgi:hypothetical protein
MIWIFMFSSKIFALLTGSSVQLASLILAQRLEVQFIHHFVVICEEKSLNVTRSQYNTPPTNHSLFAIVPLEKRLLG